MAVRDIKEIHQFLLDHNLESTAEALIQEAPKVGFQNLECKLGVSTNPYAQLMQCYTIGNYATFFQLWNDLFSDNIKQYEEYKKLTFYLHVHFALLPKRKLNTHEEHDLSSEISAMKVPSMEEDPMLEKCKENNTTEIEKNINNSMKQLQDYLNGDGKELEHDTELQPLYALPFVENLHANDFFSKMLEQSWMDQLSKNLDLFITNHKQDLVDFNNANATETESQTFEQVPVAKNKITKRNKPIIPNDRDMPTYIILEDDQDDEEHFSYKINRNLKSKSTQTHITGDQITINNLRENVLNSGENIDSLRKTHKLDKTLVQCNQELALTKTQLCSIYTNYEKLKVRFHRLHADYHKLVNVAGELTIALENSVKGQAVDIQRTLEICMKIFPDLFNQNTRETSYPSLLQLDHTDLKAIALPKFDVAAVSVPPQLLDYKKIKLHLLNGDVKTKLLLLQALRWKITLAQPVEQDEVLHEYISRDLLGLHGQIVSDNGKLVLPCLLTAGEAYAKHLLQQFTARLLNTLASFRCGRDYLSVGSTVVNVTFACLDNNYTDGMDSFACDMMIAMLQKLSLRRQQRIYMIESGLLEWLINDLHDKCRIISLYRLEYATALLMNLSLHRLAQARASKISSLVVSTLLILLSIDHAASLPYVNGALNNFLSNPIINEEARKMKRFNTLDYLDNDQKTADIRKHLDHILKMQRSENVNTPQNNETGDDENELLDVLENELDENDPLQNYVGELNGETLLAMCYSISVKNSQDVITTDRTLRNISTVNPINFYDNQHDNHLCNKRPSYPTLRYNVKTKNKLLPNKNCTKQISNLSTSSLKEQRIIANGISKESVPASNIQSIAKGFIGVDSSLITKYKSHLYEGQNKYLATLKDTVWPSSALDKQNYDKYKFDCDNRAIMRVNPRFDINNNVRVDRLKLYRSENRIDAGKLKETALESLPLKTMNLFKQTLPEGTILHDTIYLYDNRTSQNSSETALTSSMTLASGRENGQTEMEKFSSIASLNTNNHDSNIVKDTSWKNDPEIAKEEEAFLAKPKLSRTPPHRQEHYIDNSKE